MITIEDSEKLEYPNVYRWFSYIQSLRGIKNYLEKHNLPLMTSIALGTVQKPKKTKTK